MRSDIAIHVVSAHAEGEVGNVIVGGVPPPKGATLWEQRDNLHNDGTLRSVLLNEPRGGVFTHFNLLVPPVHPDAVYGFLTMEPEHTPPMSGSNTICIATVLLDCGIVPMTEPVTEFTLEAAAGPVRIRALCHAGKAHSIELTNVASFADRLGARLEVPGLGTLRVDTAYGGDSFVLVDAHEAGLSITPDNARDIARLGAIITAAANDQIGFSHPKEDWNHLSFCQFTEPAEIMDGTLTGLSAVVIDPGKIDRSPCGTGCSARLAVLAARGGISEGDAYVGRSIVGGRFDCRVTGNTHVGDKPAIIPTIRGRGWITGTHQIMRDPDDPWPNGYRLTDTWPAAS